MAKRVRPPWAIGIEPKSWSDFRTEEAASLISTPTGRTNKCLAQNNKSDSRGKATKRRFRDIKRYPAPRAYCQNVSPQHHELQEAKSIARHLGLTLHRVRSGAYRVNFRDGSETTAYYTDDLEEVVNTAVEMARTRGAMESVDQTAATRQAPSRLRALSDDELWQLYESYVWRPRGRRPDELTKAILGEIDRRAELPTQSST